MMSLKFQGKSDLQLISPGPASLICQCTVMTACWRTSHGRGEPTYFINYIYQLLTILVFVGAQKLTSIENWTWSSRGHQSFETNVSRTNSDIDQEWCDYSARVLTCDDTNMMSEDHFDASCPQSSAASPVRKDDFRAGTIETSSSHCGVNSELISQIFRISGLVTETKTGRGHTEVA